MSLDFEGLLDAFEIIVVDDHSNDGSVQSVLDHNEYGNNILLLKHEKNRGKGAAVKTGIQKSSGNAIIIQDSDLELTPSDIPHLVRAFKTGRYELVNGSRYMTGRIRPLYSYKRYFFNKLFSNLASFLIDVRFTDIACGYKLFSRELYDRLDIKEERFGFEAELIIKTAKQNKTKITEVPVNYYPRNKGDGKKIRNTDGLRIFWVIVKYGLFK